ncbi:MAG: carbohydrate ABC transporter permease [Gemmatimonadales bacterium]
MRPHQRWNRWTAALGAGVALVALTGIVLPARRARTAEVRAANTASAMAAANYLSLIVPAGPGGDYRLDFLLSAVNTLASSRLKGTGLQVAWRNTALLPDTIGLVPLESGLVRRLESGYGAVYLSRPAGRVSVVPLLDRDLWNALGWVAVWGTVSPPPVADTTMALGLVALVATILAVHFARPVEPGWHRWGAWGLALVATVLFAAGLEREVVSLARASTDAVLTRVERLAEGASTRPRIPSSQLTRLAPGARARFLPGTDGTRRIRRIEIDGEPRAVVSVPLRNGEQLEFAVIPREDRLEGLRAAFLGWCLLLALGLAFSAWAGGAQADARGFRGTLTAWGFVGPAVAHLAVFSFGPILFAGYLALHRWGLVEPVKPFVGLDNFRTVLGDGQFWHSIKVTVLYALYVPATMVISLAAALALDRSGVRVRLIRTVLFLPFISTVVAVALVWQWIYQADFGLLNAGLARLGLRGPDWLGDPRWALAAVMILSLWAQLGYQMMIFLAGLQTIPGVYHDAARVDGAGAWRRFRHITLPLLRPTLLFVLVTGTIASFQVFAYISVMTEGGPLYATDVVVYRIYQEAWEFLRFGTASAMSLVLLGFLLLITWAQFRWLGKKVELV